jgi:microcystin-dependent protein
MNAGIVVAFAGTSIPTGWKLCDGSKLDRNKKEFAALFDAIGTVHGGDGNPNFLLPDYRGMFLRGVDHGAKRDPEADTRSPPGADDNSGNSGNAVGSVQMDQLRSHQHRLPREVWAFTGKGSNQRPSDAEGGAGVVATNDDGGGEETRPKNAYVDFIIKL